MKAKKILLFLIINLSISAHSITITSIEQACDILKIPHESSFALVRKTFLRLCMKYHPDKNFGNEVVAAEKFKEIIAAYEYLQKNLKTEEINYCFENDKNLELYEIFADGVCLYYGIFSNYEEIKLDYVPDYVLAVKIFSMLINKQALTTQYALPDNLITEAYVYLAKIYLTGGYGILKNLYLAQKYAQEACKLGSCEAYEVLEEIKTSDKYSRYKHLYNTVSCYH